MSAGAACRVDRPDAAGREAVLRVHTRKMPLAADVNLAGLARMADGCAALPARRAAAAAELRLKRASDELARCRLSAAELANIANEAAIMAARRESENVTNDDFSTMLRKYQVSRQRIPSQGGSVFDFAHALSAAAAATRQ